MLPTACVAVALGGCSLTPSNSASSTGFSGQKALIASTLNLLASDASGSNGADICKNVLIGSLQSTLNKTGGCSTVIDNQLKTIDDFTLTVESITLAGSTGAGKSTVPPVGSTASARVKTEVNGKKVISTVSLTHTKAGWRIASISAL